jgi:hypothetical protein
MLQVRYIVFDDETEGFGSIRPDPALDFEPVGRNAPDDTGKVAVIEPPERG